MWLKAPCCLFCSLYIFPKVGISLHLTVFSEGLLKTSLFVLFLCQTCFKCSHVEREGGAFLSWWQCKNSYMSHVTWDRQLSALPRSWASTHSLGWEFHPSSVGPTFSSCSSRNFPVFYFTPSSPETPSHWSVKPVPPPLLSSHLPPPLVPVQLGMYNLMKVLSINIFPLSHCWAMLCGHPLTCFNLYWLS